MDASVSQPRFWWLEARSHSRNVGPNQIREHADSRSAASCVVRPVPDALAETGPATAARPAAVAKATAATATTTASAGEATPAAGSEHAARIRAAAETVCHGDQQAPRCEPARSRRKLAAPLQRSSAQSATPRARKRLAIPQAASAATGAAAAALAAFLQPASAAAGAHPQPDGNLGAPHARPE